MRIYAKCEIKKGDRQSAREIEREIRKERIFKSMSFSKLWQSDVQRIDECECEFDGGGGGDDDGGETKMYYFVKCSILCGSVSSSLFLFSANVGHANHFQLSISLYAPKNSCRCEKRKNLDFFFFFVIIAWM